MRVLQYRASEGGYMQLAILNAAGSADIAGVEFRKTPETVRCRVETTKREVRTPPWHVTGEKAARYFTRARARASAQRLRKGVSNGRGAALLPPEKG